MTTATSWQIQGDILEACSCDITCPCNFGGGPTELPCEAIFAFRIQEGNYGNTQLNDLNFALYLRSPGPIFQGTWTLGAYLDERSSPEQMQALGAILSGEAGGGFGALSGLIGNALPPKQVPITFQTADGEHHITVPGLLEVASERIPNPMEGQPPLDPKASGLAVPFYTGDVSIRRSSVMRVTDPGLSFEHAGGSSLIGRFDFSGP